jgi:hypothetical protein
MRSSLSHPVKSALRGCDQPVVRRLSPLHNAHGEQTRSRHTNGPRDVPLFGALNLLQELMHYKGWFQLESCTVFVYVGLGPVVVLLPVPAFHSQDT